MPKIFASNSPAITEREKQHAALSRQAAGECVVLLENDGTLPLKPCRIALYGMGARHTIKGGTGSGDVNTRSSVNIETGLREAGFEITTDSWLRRNEEKRTKAYRSYLESVPRMAEEEGCSEFLATFYRPYRDPAPEKILEEDISLSDSDTAIYVICRNSGEGADRYNRRGDYLLYEEEKEQLTLLGEKYPSVILVLNIGGVMDLSEVKQIPGINAVVLMSQLGNMGGQVLADVLTGLVNPSGRLTDTWAKSYADYPASASFSHNDGNIDDEYYAEGIYVGYRYFDTFGVEPLYPFGYGKSYTDFEVKTENVSVEHGIVSVTVQVKNTGNYAGKEVVQAYYSSPAGMISKPYQELAAFAKTRELQPGEREKLILKWPVQSMASYCEACAAWVLEAGAYLVRVGVHSRCSETVAVLLLDKTVKAEICRNLFRDADPVKEIEAPTLSSVSGDRWQELEKTVGVPQIEMDSDTIETRHVTYQGERQAYTSAQTERLTMAEVRAGSCTLEEMVSQMSVEELASFCVGTLRQDGGSVVGNASSIVPGAAGDSSSICQESRGIKNMIMADGPAGLRLQPVFKTDKEGRLLPGGAILGDLVEPFDPCYTEENSNTYYQYCTAIPIGWALAQSWDPNMLEGIGFMVGEEMEQFGVDLWLAPALNIHRDPLCGRNFEYYSEDPLVAGKAAAAITRGVQRHPGKGTTIKHFAANSQEDNRYFTNSHIGERAIREIYLKGFEIAIRESQPLAVMTSYNLLNGVHTANSHDLLQTVARDEWGFHGMFMTDWSTSQDVPEITGSYPAKYPISASTGCVYAGNDLQMPGCQKNVDDLVEAVTTGMELDGYKVTLADLQFSAANVIRVAAATMTE